MQKLWAGQQKTRYFERVKLTRQYRYLFILLGLFGLLLLYLLWLTRDMEAYVPVAAAPAFAFSDDRVRVACQEEVKLNLHSPSAARFREVSFYDLSVNDGFKTYVFDVEAPNLYGVVLTERFGCAVESDGTLSLDQH